MYLLFNFIANVFLDVKKDNATLVKGSVGKIETLASGQKSAIGKGISRKQVLSKTMCEPNFSCPFCDAAFVRIDSMQSHLRQHQKLQPELQQDIFALQQHRNEYSLKKEQTRDDCVSDYRIVNYIVIKKCK